MSASRGPPGRDLGLWPRRRHTLAGDLCVLRIQIEPDESAAQTPRYDGHCARADERVEDDAALWTAGQDGALAEGLWEAGRMPVPGGASGNGPAVAGVAPEWMTCVGVA